MKVTSTALKEHYMTFTHIFILAYIVFLHHTINTAWSKGRQLKPQGEATKALKFGISLSKN